MKSGIYCILNTANGKRYVGQSNDMQDRIKHHFAALRYGRHYNTYLQRAYDKYGKECFEYSILVYCGPNLSDTFEREWIAYYKSNEKDFGYNAENGGCANKVHSLHSRELMSKNRTGKKPQYSLEGKAAMRAAAKHAWATGKMENMHSKEVNKKRADAVKKYYKNPENRKKLSEALKKNRTTPQYNAKISALRKAEWADPIMREKRLGVMRTRATSQEYKEQRRKIANATWADPVIRKRRIDAMNAAQRCKEQQEKTA